MPKFCSLSSHLRNYPHTSCRPKHNSIYNELQCIAVRRPLNLKSPTNATASALPLIILYLCTVDVHVFRILGTFPHLSPVLTVNIIILALVSTLVTGHRAVDQHPARVLLALVDGGPVGAVLVGVLATGLDPGLGGGLGCGDNTD